MSRLDEQAISVIERLHMGIEGWIRGTLSKSAFEPEIAAHLSPDFRIVDPEGDIASRDAIVKGLYAGHSSNPAFRISIERASCIAADENFVVVTYIERQRGALRAKRRTNARRSTALLVPTDNAPRLAWLHETWTL